MAGVTLREDEALRSLRAKLNVPPAAQNCNPHLLRFLRATALNPDEAAAKLERRVLFEQSLSTIFTSPHVVSALRSGAFATIGDDVFHRPILYLKVKAYHHSGSQTDETRLAVVLLEYLQTLVESKNVEQCIILVNEEGAGFWAAQDSPLHEQIATLIQKHYPGLIGAVLVVNSSWGTKRIIRLQVAAGASSVRDLVQFVSSKDLASLIAADVVPTDFGGQNDVPSTCPAEDFSDRVLRHWYALTGVLQRHAQEADGHPAWQPLPRMELSSASIVASDAVKRRIATAAEVAHNKPPGTPGRLSSLARGGATPRGQRAVDEYTDDGRCSMITDTDFNERSVEDDFDDHHHADGATPGFPLREGAAAGDGDGDEDVVALKHQLHVETTRRRELEQTVERLRLGTIDESQAKPLEATLRKHHEHVNALVAQIVQQNRGVRPERSLAQLLDQTETALLSAVPDTHETPCMSAATYQERKPRSSCVVC